MEIFSHVCALSKVDFCVVDEADIRPRHQTADLITKSSKLGTRLKLFWVIQPKIRSVLSIVSSTNTVLMF